MATCCDSVSCDLDVFDTKALDNTGSLAHLVPAAMKNTGAYSNAFITLHQLFVVCSRFRIAVSVETAGYIALAIADGIASDPVALLTANVKPHRVHFSVQGNVSLATLDLGEQLGAQAVQEAFQIQTCKVIQGILATLLRLSVGHSPSLEACAHDRSVVSLQLLIARLEAALVPVNRAAARRNVARLVRDVLRVVPSDSSCAAETLEPLNPPAKSARANAIPSKLKSSHLASFHPARSRSCLYSDLFQPPSLEPSPTCPPCEPCFELSSMDSNSSDLSADNTDPMPKPVFVQPCGRIYAPVGQADTQPDVWNHADLSADTSVRQFQYNEAEHYSDMHLNVQSAHAGVENAEQSHRIDPVLSAETSEQHNPSLDALCCFDQAGAESVVNNECYDRTPLWNSTWNSTWRGSQNKSSLPSHDGSISSNKCARYNPLADLTCDLYSHTCRMFLHGTGSTEPYVSDESLFTYIPPEATCDVSLNFAHPGLTYVLVQDVTTSPGIGPLNPGGYQLNYAHGQSEEETIIQQSHADDESASSNLTPLHDSSVIYAAMTPAVEKSARNKPERAVSRGVAVQRVHPRCEANDCNTESDAQVTLGKISRVDSQIDEAVVKLVDHPCGAESKALSDMQKEPDAKAQQPVRSSRRWGGVMQPLVYSPPKNPKICVAFAAIMLVLLIGVLLGIYWMFPAVLVGR